MAHSHTHSHDHAHPEVHLRWCKDGSCWCEPARYVAILIIGIIILAVQLYAARLSGGLSLYADSTHVALDDLGAGISIYVAIAARKHPHPEALRIRWMQVSAGVLLIALAFLGYEAIERFQNPQPVKGVTLAFAAGIGLVLNLAQLLFVRGDPTATARAQAMHVLADAGSSLAVVVGGCVIFLTDWYAVDPFLTFIVIGIVGWHAWPMLRGKHAHAH